MSRRRPLPKRAISEWQILPVSSSEVRNLAAGRQQEFKAL
jgi:hypothetical protein